MYQSAVSVFFNRYMAAGVCNENILSALGKKKKNHI